MSRFLHRVSLAVALAATMTTTLAAPARAQADTVGGGKVGLFTWRDAVLMGAFITATGMVKPLDKSVAKSLQDSTVQANRTLGDVASFVRDVATPYSFYIGAGLYAYGKIAKDRKAADLGLHGTEALVVGQLLGTVLKGTFGRARPHVNIDNPDDFQFGRGFQKGKESYRSFPSGHTISAFAAAAAVTSETSRWWPNTRWVVGPLLYGGAAMAGASRMYNNKHWFSDVMMGAAIGTFAGLKVVRWHHSHPGNKLDRWLLSGSVSLGPQGAALVHWTVTPDFTPRGP